MPIQNAEELFLTLLSDAYAREQHMAQFWDSFSQNVQDQEAKNIVSTRAYFTRQSASNIERCFQLLGKQPMPPNTHWYQTWAEDCRREFDAIQNPGMKALYVLATIRHAQNWAIAEYFTLTAMAAAVGNTAVTRLLEHNLADYVDFVDRSREMVRDTIRQGIQARVAGRAA